MSLSLISEKEDQLSEGDKSFLFSLWDVEKLALISLILLRKKIRFALSFWEHRYLRSTWGVLRETLVLIVSNMTFEVFFIIILFKGSVSFLKCNCWTSNMVAFHNLSTFLHCLLKSHILSFIQGVCFLTETRLCLTGATLSEIDKYCLLKDWVNELRSPPKLNYDQKKHVHSFLVDDVPFSRHYQRMMTDIRQEFKENTRWEHSHLRLPLKYDQ